MEEYIPNVKSKEEFILRFNALYFELNNNLDKSTAEFSLFKRLESIKNYLEINIPLKAKKDDYNNMLPYFELGGGWEMMESNIGKEATDLLYFFVQNY